MFPINYLLMARVIRDTGQHHLIRFGNFNMLQVLQFSRFIQQKISPPCCSSCCSFCPCCRDNKDADKPDTCCNKDISPTFRGIMTWDIKANLVSVTHNWKPPYRGPSVLQNNPFFLKRNREADASVTPNTISAWPRQEIQAAKCCCEWGKSWKTWHCDWQLQ